MVWERRNLEREWARMGLELLVQKWKTYDSILGTQRKIMAFKIPWQGFVFLRCGIVLVARNVSFVISNSRFDWGYTWGLEEHSTFVGHKSLAKVKTNYIYHKVADRYAWMLEQVTKEWRITRSNRWWQIAVQMGWQPRSFRSLGAWAIWELLSTMWVSLSGVSKSPFQWTFWSCGVENAFFTFWDSLSISKLMGIVSQLEYGECIFLYSTWGSITYSTIKMHIGIIVNLVGNFKEVDKWVHVICIG